MKIFTNPEERRLRAGWRLGAQFFLMYLIALGLIWGISRFISFSGHWIPTTAFAAGAVISIILAAKGMDRRSRSDFGLEINASGVRECGFTFMLAGTAMGIIFLIEYSAGWVSFIGFGWMQLNNEPYVLMLGSYFLFMVLVGFYEELIFRGYQIVNLSEGFNGSDLSRGRAVIGAVVLSSVIFGLMHAMNPNAGWISTSNVALAGLMLAFPFVITGRLWGSIGLHIGWNFFQGGVFGFSVSGLPGRASVLQIKQQGPELLTGGGFGPEAGLLGILGYVIIIAGLLWYYRRTDQAVAVHSRMGAYHPVKP
jgi:membrane protease YdiL (CAAX protease family)